jgi:hypothetical protein
LFGRFSCLVCSIERWQLSAFYDDFMSSFDLIWLAYTWISLDHGRKARGAMDSLKLHLSPPCPTLPRSVGGPTLKQPFEAIFYPLGHPIQYAYDEFEYGLPTLVLDQPL